MTISSAALPERRTWFRLALFFVVPNVLSAQPPLPDVVTPRRLPTQMQAVFDRLGGRLLKPGALRATYTGFVQDDKGRRPVQVVWQPPGVFRYEETGAIRTSVIFDGTDVRSSAGPLAAAQLRLLESLFADLPENLLYGMATETVITFAGGRFRLDDGKALNYTGPFLDYYEIYTPGASQQRNAVALPEKKIVGLDSTTLLPARVMYNAQSLPGRPRVLTEFRSWKRNAAGDAYPAQIVRFENGVEVLRLDLDQFETGSKADLTLFRQP